MFPFMTWYADNAHCYSPLGFSGISVLWYALFVGIPLLSAFLVAIFSLPLGIKGLIHHQFPPKGVKVYQPTVIITGNKAKIKSLGHIIAPGIFVAIGVWGYFQVDKMPDGSNSNLDFSICQS